MSSDFNWDEYKQPDNRFKFETPGQSVAGTVTQIRVTDFGTGKPEDRTPELWVTTDDGTELSVTASQLALRSKLAEHRPQVGDRIAIVYTGDGVAKPPKSAPKLFDVKVVRGPGTTAAAAPTGQPAVGERQAEPVAATAGPSASDLI